MIERLGRAAEAEAAVAAWAAEVAEGRVATSQAAERVADQLLSTSRVQ